MKVYEKPRLRFEEIQLGERIADTCWGLHTKTGFIEFRGSHCNCSIQNKKHHANILRGLDSVVIRLSSCDTDPIISAFEQKLNMDLDFYNLNSLSNTHCNGFGYGECQS